MGALRGMSNEETRLQNAIQEALCWLPGCEAWALTTARRGKLAFGLRELSGNVAGGADIIGCVDGLLLWCEVKLPGKDVEPGSHQERRLEIARKLGAIAFVAHSVEEAVNIVKRRQRQLQKERQLLHCLSLATEDMGELANAAENIVLRRALRAALNTWCPSDPGGDGADGETYRLCCEALGLGESEEDIN
jgi:hypothetical protein